MRSLTTGGDRRGERGVEEWGSGRGKPNRKKQEKKRCKPQAFPSESTSIENYGSYCAKWSRWKEDAELSEWEK